jgi:hypothetical protein
MSTKVKHESAGSQVSRRYARYGIFGGFGIGAIIGVLVSGPHFYEWSSGLSLAVIFGSAVAVAAIGWFASSIVGGMLSGDHASFDSGYHDYGTGGHGGIAGDGDVSIGGDS